jgi:hypothetical protein
MTNEINTRLLEESLSLCVDIVTCYSDSRQGFELDIGFIDHLPHNSKLQVIIAPLLAPHFINHHSTR